MKKIIIINGPNLNLLGKRQPEIYGNTSFEDHLKELVGRFSKEVQLTYFQSNHEGAIIDKLHEVGFEYDGIILNAGAYTHTSYAISDAIAGISSPVIEVHISNIHAREAFRANSVTAKNAVGCVAGLGLKGYTLAISYFLEA